MTKRKFSFLILALCILLVVSLLCGCYGNPGENSDNDSSNSSETNKNKSTNESNSNESNNSSIDYKLTVQDPNGYIIEELQEQYKAGEEVIVKTKTMSDVDLIAYLDGVSLGLETQKQEKGEYHWEFYFVMPAHDAILSFEFSDGLTKNGITLDEAAQTEIKTAFYNKYVDKYPDLAFEQLSLRCYGEFDGVYVIFEDGVWGRITAITSEVIAGVKFIYPDGLQMTVYCNNAFYKLSEAYENGILSYDNILKTQETYKACNINLYINDYGVKSV